MLQQLKVAAAIIVLALGCGAAGAALMHRFDPPAVMEKVIVHEHHLAPPPSPKVDTPRRPVARKPAHHHHSVPHVRDSEDDSADRLNHGQL